MALEPSAKRPCPAGCLVCRAPLPLVCASCMTAFEDDDQESIATPIPNKPQKEDLELLQQLIAFVARRNRIYTAHRAEWLALQAHVKQCLQEGRSGEGVLQDILARVEQKITTV